MIMEKLTGALLKALCDKPESLRAAVDVLGQLAPTPSEKESQTSATEQSFKELITKYKHSQAAKKGEISKGKKSAAASVPLFALNFARYRRSLNGYRKSSPNVQVVGFKECDTHGDVIRKGAEGLGLTCDCDLLILICSGGMVPDSPIGDVPWTLGEYIRQHGGNQNRSKKVWGICIPVGIDDEMEDVSYTMNTGDSGCVQERKRSASSLTAISSKKFKQARSQVPAVRQDYVDLSSSSTVDQVGTSELSLKDLVVKYCPVIDGKINDGVTAVGLIGAWRMMNLGYHLCDADVLEKISQVQPFQPESHHLVISEISQGGTCYLKNNVAIGTSMPKNNVRYHVQGTELLHCSKTQIISPISKCATLVVISPKHGKLDYVWEKKGVEEIDDVFFPYNTSVLYVQSAGVYQCTIEGETIEFKVQGYGDSVEVGINELKFDKLIGRGSFGQVYKGVWKGKTVALKRITIPPGTDVSSLPAIPKEINVLRKLKHPNIITLLAYCITHEQIVLVMNYVKGSNLDSILFSKHLFNQRKFSNVDVALKITDAVNYMHTNSPIIIHQDIKPQNILVSADCKEVFVCDMGIAKIKELNVATATCCGNGPGTIPYMAPEMFKKCRRGPAVDMYSLGCLFIELFGRRRVWEGCDSTNIMMKVLGSYKTPPEGPSTSHLSTKIQNLCSDLCHLDASKRPNSKKVLEMLGELGITTMET